MFFSQFNDQEKKEIAHQLKDHTDESALKDYDKLKLALSGDLDTIKPLSPVGLKFIENFVYIELLSTKSKQGISFYDFWYNRDYYMTRDNATKNLVASIKKNKPYLTEIKIGKQVFNLYCGGIHIFRPVNAAKIYNQFKPTTILDFTMGWGGRLLGAVLLNIPKYIGIDMNTKLVEPYEKMVSHFKKDKKTEIELHFKNALDIDYSQLDYDMVFTSPPFYNKEAYGDQKEIYNRTKDEWDEQFYKPIFKKTWEYLKPGGVYCLNVPNYLYERVCLDIFGEANEMIELKKYSRILPKKENAKQFNVGQKYKEYIYIWKKEIK